MEQVEPGCVEFLDLSGIEDHRERNFILSSLHSWNPNIQLPWMEDVSQQQSSQGYDSQHIANVKLQKRTSSICNAPPNLMVATNINVNDGSQHPPLYSQIPPYTIPQAQPITMYAQQHNIATFPPNLGYTQPNSVSNIQTTFVMNSNATYNMGTDNSNIYMNTEVEITQGFTNQPHISNNGVGYKNQDFDVDNLPEDHQNEDDETVTVDQNGETSFNENSFSSNNQNECSSDNMNVTPEVSTPPAKSWASLFNKPKSTEPTKNTSERDSTPSKPLALAPPYVSNSSDEKSASPNVALLLKEPFKSNADDPNLHRMGEYLSTHTVDNRIISLQPRGLINRSNYCYINSILQAMLACPPVYNLLSGLAENTSASTEKKRITPTIDSMTRFVKEFNHLPAGMRVGRRVDKNQKKEHNGVSQYINTLINCDTPFEPFWIHKLLSGVRSDMFVVEGRQEDAEEFLGCLLNGLNDEMLELIKLVGGHQVSNETTQDKNSSAQDEDREWQVMGPKNKGSITRRTEFSRTPISDIFGGLLRSRLHRAGDQSTDNIQPFFTLQLNIEKTNTVKEALEVLACKNQLEGVTSSKTNEEVEAWQQVTLEELPIVLVLHLKCFDYKLDGCSKIIKVLEFPIDLKIDMKLLSSKTNYTAKERQYKLFSVVYHEGKEATKGHYVTDAYHVGYASWLRYDDASVKTVPEEHVLKPHGTRVPYLLFYRRSDALSKSK